MPSDDAWCVEPDAGDGAAAALLGQDPGWTGYVLADLEPPFRRYTTVALASRRAHPPAAACAVLRHPEFCATIPYGDPAGVAAILAATALPPRTSLAVRAEHWPALARHYALPADPRAMRRMTVTAATFTPPAGNLPVVEQLGANDATALQELYAGYPDNAFIPDQISAGVFYGARASGGLLAAGGTHVVSVRYGVAAVGNIFTLPAARGRGYATAVTAAVTSAVLARGCTTVILNVAATNTAASRIYERLGFREHCRFFEVETERRMAAAPVTIRPMVGSDLDAVIGVWHASKHAAYWYLPTEQGLTLADNDRIFRTYVLPGLAIWVAETDGAIAGFLAMKGSYVDRLYVRPQAQGRGVGSALMVKAKELSPAGLQLHTHQQNTQARAFYERRGFRAVRFGISPPPESAPDVEYHWAPER